MELNVFTEQLEKCYNLLAQQFVLIKQLKDLTISDKTNTEDINTIKTSILNLQNQLNGMVNEYVSKDTYEELVRETPTDVRVVKDQDKWQLQLEHDSNVLSIDEGLQTALEDWGGVKLYSHRVVFSDPITPDEYEQEVIDREITIFSNYAKPFTESMPQNSNPFFFIPGKGYITDFKDEYSYFTIGFGYETDYNQFFAIFLKDTTEVYFVKPLTIISDRVV